MIRIGCGLLVAVMVVGFMSGLNAQNRELSEFSKLRAENFKLKAQLANCQSQIISGNLIEEFRQELGESKDSQFDWNSLQLRKGNK